jgi:long-subunit fatty acid transport protein
LAVSKKTPVYGVRGEGWLGRTCVSVLLAGALFTSASVTSAWADWAQTLGIGQKSTNLGGAVTAAGADYDVFYTNPAGAAAFDSVMAGVGLKTLDTRTIKVKQIDAQTGFPILDPGKSGLDLSPSRTLSGSALAYIPSGGVYSPIPGYNNIVAGVGFGAPFVVSADFGNDRAAGNYGKFVTTDAAIIAAEVAPTVAMKVNDRLNVGVSVGFVTFKYLKLKTDFGTRLGAFSLASANLETNTDITLPIPPSGFAASFGETSFTVGAQYKIMPNVSLGLVYRSAVDVNFDGRVGVQALGFLNFKDKFEYETQQPRHLQGGVAWDVNPTLRLMADLRWTNWSDTKGFGQGSVIKLTQGNVNVLGALTGNFLGRPIRALEIDYRAQDTVSLHLGASYKLTPRWELQAGYVYDPTFMPTKTLDLITFSSDRHIVSAGATYKLPTVRGGEWDFTFGGQLTLYEERDIKAGQSAVAGGVNNTIEALLTQQQNLVRKSNILGGFEFGGYLWSVGASASYKFGANPAALEPGSGDEGSTPGLLLEKRAANKAIEAAEEARHTFDGYNSQAWRARTERDSGRKEALFFLRNTNFRFFGDIGFFAPQLVVSARPVDETQPIVLDDPKSFSFAVLSGSVTLSAQNLTALLNEHTFNYPAAPLRKLTAKTRDDALILSGELNRRGRWVPFSMEGPMSVANGSTLLFRPTRTLIDGQAADAILSAANVDLDELITIRAPGAYLEKSTIYLDAQQIFPPPRLLLSIRKVGLSDRGLTLDLNGGGPAPQFVKPPKASDSFIVIRGGDVKFLSVMLVSALMQIEATQGGERLDFSLYDYRKQLEAGHFSFAPDGAAMVYLKNAAAMNLGTPLP